MRLQTHAHTCLLKDVLLFAIWISFILSGVSRKTSILQVSVTCCLKTPQNASVHTQTHLCTHRLFIVLNLCESNTITLYYIRCGSRVSYLLSSKPLFSLSSKMTIDLDFLDAVCPTADSCPLPFELTFEVRLMRVNLFFPRDFFLFSIQCVNLKAFMQQCCCWC